MNLKETALMACKIGHIVMLLFKMTGIKLIIGGDDRDRTDGLYVANVPLSQLSYIPTPSLKKSQMKLPAASGGVSSGIAP
jgi:hypothetical protein